MEFIGGNRANSENFSKSVLLVYQILQTIQKGIMTGKKFRAEMIYDPEKEKKFRLIAATCEGDDTDEKFHKYYEF